MSYGPSYRYSATMKVCALCSKPLKAAPARPATPARPKLEKRATELGLTQTQ